MTENRPFDATASLDGVWPDVFTDWLVECDQNWHDGVLDEALSMLPEELSSWRDAALFELVRIDVVQSWRRRKGRPLEEWLVRFSELGTAETVSPELIAAELEGRQLAGEVISQEQLSARFPLQATTAWKLFQRSPDDTKLPANTDQIVGGNTSLESDAQELEITHPYASSDTTPGGSFPAAVDQKLQPGQHFDADGRFEIQRELGRGGMASVFLAKDLRLGREVAIKVPRGVVVEHPELLQRFRVEAQSLASVKHTHLADVYDTADSDGIPYVVMEFVNGVTLAEHLKEHSPTAEESVTLVRDVALALVAAHEQNIIHRDLKPENIMLTADLQPKVIDFGLALNISAEGPRQTRFGEPLGTPHYMPFEQMQGNIDAIGPASDVYSLGVVLYRLLTEKVPYPGEQFFEVLTRMMTQPLPSPLEHQPDLDPGLVEIVLKAVQKEPADRYVTMEEFAGTLTAWLERAIPESMIDGRSPAAVSQTDGSTTTNESPRFLSHRMRATLTGGAGLILLGVIIVTITSKNGPGTTLRIHEGIDVSVDVESGSSVAFTKFDSTDTRLKPTAPSSNEPIVVEPPVVKPALPDSPPADNGAPFESLVSDGVLADIRIRDYSDRSVRPGWVTENGVLRSAEQGDKMISFGHRYYKDFRLTADYKITGERGSVFVAHSEWRGDRAKGYSVGLGNRDRNEQLAGAIFHWKYKSDFTHALHPGNGANGPDEDEWATLDVTLLSNQLTATINGKLVGHASVSEKDYPDGEVAFACPPETILYLKNVQIRELSEKPLALPNQTKPIVKGLFEGNWRIEDNELITEIPLGPHSQWWTFGDPAWSDFDLKVETCFSGRNPSYVIILRHTSKESGWHVGLGPWGAKNLDLVCLTPDEDPWKNSARRYMAGRLHGKSDVWQTVEVQARGAEVAVSVDGKFMTKSSHPDVLRGLIGFHTYGGGIAKWRNLELRAPDGALLWSGFPDLPSGE